MLTFSKFESVDVRTDSLLSYERGLALAASKHLSKLNLDQPYGIRPNLRYKN